MDDVPVKSLHQQYPALHQRRQNVIIRPAKKGRVLIVRMDDFGPSKGSNNDDMVHMLATGTEDEDDDLSASEDDEISVHHPDLTYQNLNLDDGDSIGSLDAWQQQQNLRSTGDPPSNDSPPVISDRMIDQSGGGSGAAVAVAAPAAVAATAVQIRPGITNVNKTVSFEQKDATPPSGNAVAGRPTAGRDKTPQPQQQYAGMVPPPQSQQPPQSIANSGVSSPVNQQHQRQPVQQFSPINSVPPSESQFMDSPRSHQHTVLTIEHRTTTDRSIPFFLGMSKPVFAGVASLLLFTSGTTAYFFSQFLRIPGLEVQIQDLENQVTRLEAELVQLEETIEDLNEETGRVTKQRETLQTEVDRVEGIYGSLLRENNETQENVDTLQQENTRLTGQLYILNQTLERLSNETDIFEEENRFLNNLTVALTEATDSLALRRSELNQTFTELSNVVRELGNDAVDLNSTVLMLQAENQLLNETIQNFTHQISRFQDENEILDERNGQLSKVVDFLADLLSNRAETTVEALLEQMQEGIDQQQVLLLNNIETNYDSLVLAWRCDYPLDFAGMAFVLDESSPIGPAAYSGTITHVSERVLEPLCLQILNFEDYVANDFELASLPNNMTMQHLRSGLERYTSEAMSYYFNDLNQTDWSQANFTCGNLEKPFFVEV